MRPHRGLGGPVLVEQPGLAEPVAAGQDLDEPFLITRQTGPALRTNDLADGVYELFVTAAKASARSIS